MQNATDISTKTLMPVFNASGCVGHILRMAVTPMIVRSGYSKPPRSEERVEGEDARRLREREAARKYFSMRLSRRR